MVARHRVIQFRTVTHLNVTFAEEQRGLNEIKEKAQMETIDLLAKELAAETEKVSQLNIHR